MVSLPFFGDGSGTSACTVTKCFRACFLAVCMEVLSMVVGLSMGLLGYGISVLVESIRKLSAGASTRVLAPLTPSTACAEAVANSKHTTIQ